MGEDLPTAAQKILMSVITLGVFCFISMAYSVFVWTSKPGGDARESRLRAFMLAGVIAMTGSILVLGSSLLAEAVAMLASMNVNVSSALKSISQMRISTSNTVLWGAVGALAALALIPTFVPDEARRVRLNKVMAGVSFASTLPLVLLTTALYVTWRTLQALTEQGGV